MKVIEIAIFLLCLQVSMGILNGLGIFETQKQLHQDWLDDIYGQGKNLEDKSYQESPVATEYQFDLGATIKGVFFFGVTVGKTIVNVPYMLSIFGMRAPFSYLISIIIYFIYILALAEFISNRGTKSMH